MPGPSDGLTLLGAPLLAHYPLSLIFDGIALNITVVSYRDGMDIGVVGDAEAVPDAADLVEDLRTEFAALLRLTTED
ncbi:MULTISPECIES: WS/DGAT domain-containing protein [Mycobacteriaceae]|uniref:WS/DGAT domain-containing protein n=1 Tax=Mycobacteriaceae TaxID=1762 RepID=UPI0012FE8AFD|nr:MULTISPECIES: WS/DGAT domain-containing protein [Mycobacteriaceae]MDO3399476.1 WS/DGAT domain-containing protein [Mycolicibacterium neoaurum]